MTAVAARFRLEAFPMEDHTAPPAELSALPEFTSLAPEGQSQLVAMHDNMHARGLPPALVQAGLRSTARLLLERQAAEAPRMESEHVRRFIEANKGTPVSRRRRVAPRKETRQRSRESLHDRLSSLILSARSATRRHELLRLRREMLGLDQGYIRRTLGAEGERLCGEMNAWLMDAATRLRER
jgi:hypothetical protein